MSNAIALFAKAPIPGAVKTRLQPHLSAEQAAALHLAFVQDTWAMLNSIEGVTVHFYSDHEWPAFRDLAGPERLGLQRGADLGEKMLHCFEDLSQQGHDRKLIVGSDSPTLPPENLRAGLEVLREVDAVLGPCEDGGYYAVGCCSSQAGMFDEVSWSSSSTLAETEGAFARVGLASRRLPAWYDVDTIENLRRLVSEGDLSEHTRRWIDQNPGL